MSPKGRPEGEYRSAQHEGSPVSPKGRPKGEHRSAQHEGSPVSAASSPAAAAAVLHAVVGGALAHQRGRLVMSMLAIALGVALGFAVAVINEAAIGEFTGGIKSLAGIADFEVRGPRGGFPEALFADLARDPDVAVASPVVEVDARIAGRDDALRVYGVDAFRAGRHRPALRGDGHRDRKSVV